MDISKTGRKSPFMHKGSVETKRQQRDFSPQELTKDEKPRHGLDAGEIGSSWDDTFAPMRGNLKKESC